jgi:hypothetical protein
MALTAGMVASEILMCGVKAGIKQIPIVGEMAVHVVEGLQRRHEALNNAARMAEIEAQLTRVERGMRDTVEKEIRTILANLGRPALPGPELTREMSMDPNRYEVSEPELLRGLRLFGRDWDRSATWSQFRSIGRQRGWWLHTAGPDRRIRPRRSARWQMRGVMPASSCGMAKLAADGPARLSSSVSRAWWTGPPPIRLPRAATGHDRLARSSRRSPSGGAACGFWTRAWSHASPLFKEPAT